jgi:release factor glutamine methyltransferase
MENNVLNYEPHLALFVEDNDPLLFYRKIAEYGLNHLKTKGRLYFEIHERYADEVQSLLVEMGFSNIEVRQDAQGKERMVRGVL